MALNFQFSCKCLSTVRDSFATVHHQSQPSMLVVNKFILRPHSLPFPFLSPPCFFTKSLTFSSLSGNSTAAVTLCSALDHQSLPYGPSLRKGRNPFSSIPSPVSIDSQTFPVPENQGNDINLFNEECFTRVFNIATLRVPAENCFALESRLRGHLLNWPRIRNIARVPGDEIDEELKKLFDNDHSNSDTSGDDGNALADLNRRIYGKEEGDGEPLSPVLYRDKLAMTFNSRGFVRFRNLAKLSRPRRRNTKTKVEEKKGGKKHGVGKNEMCLVEVVGEDEKRSREECDLSGLLGDTFFSSRWRGPTRLLLLDEQYADSEIDDMPQAIKAVFEEYLGDNMATGCELVKCRLTLYYSYWQMNEVLEALLPKDLTVPSTFETVGHIAHLNLREEHLPYKRIIAKVVLDKNKPKIQTVVNKIDAIQNDYRTMQLEVLAGNHSLVTTVVENGLRFHVDLATVYWNSRLATERQRLLNCFSPDDVVCDVFAGVGPIALAAAKKVKRVYANDLNPYAVDYLERNSVLNKIERKIEVFNMDGRRFIDALFSNQNNYSITQVVMNLPNDAAEFLDAFRGVLRENGKEGKYTLPRIHVYGFSRAQDPEFDFHERIRIALCEVGFNIEMRKVRLVAPGKWMLCASFILPESVAFAKRVPTL